METLTLGLNVDGAAQVLYHISDEERYICFLMLSFNVVSKYHVIYSD